MNELRLALLNLPTVLGDPIANAENLVCRMREASAAGAQLVVGTELMLTGYTVGRFADMARACEDRIAVIADEAQRLGLYVGFGLPMVQGGKLYNAYAVAGPGGSTVFGKMHRWWHGDREFEPWRELKLMDIHGFRVGVMVCFDGRYPEAARSLALLGADLILWPSNWPCAPKSNPEYLQVIGKARSFENQCFVALANRDGGTVEENTDYAGGSALFGPTGKLEAEAGQAPQVLFATAGREKLEQLRANFDIYTERDPVAYGPLSRKAPPWWHGAGSPEQGERPC